MNEEWFYLEYWTAGTQFMPIVWRSKPGTHQKLAYSPRRYPTRESAQVAWTAFYAATGYAIDPFLLSIEGGFALAYWIKFEKNTDALSEKLHDFTRKDGMPQGGFEVPEFPSTVVDLYA